jgi:hypothetical protein
VKLSDIENLLAVTFAILAVGAKGAVAPASMDIFFDQGSFERKLKLTNLIVELTGTADEIKRWENIFQSINTHRGVRNLMAHQGMSIEQSHNTPQVSVSLREPWLKKNSKGRQLQTPEAYRTGLALAEWLCRTADRIDPA